MYEVEQKYHVSDAAALRSQLQSMGAVEQTIQQHRDSYYNHPCRDFAQTTEAFRIRRVDGVPMITYKSAKLPGEIKARRELEWRLDPGDPDGSNMEQLLDLLGFVPVAVVEKRRHSYTMPDGQSSTPNDAAQLSVVIDEVTGLGIFAEIELIAPDSATVESARKRISGLGQSLGLDQPEPRSYLRMILAKED